MLSFCTVVLLISILAKKSKHLRCFKHTEVDFQFLISDSENQKKLSKVVPNTKLCHLATLLLG